MSEVNKSEIGAGHFGSELDLLPPSSLVRNRVGKEFLLHKTFQPHAEVVSDVIIDG